MGCCLSEQRCRLAQFPNSSPCEHTVSRMPSRTSAPYRHLYFNRQYFTILFKTKQIRAEVIDVAEMSALVFRRQLVGISV
jgi:hypothetical protein